MYKLYTCLLLLSQTILGLSDLMRFIFGEQSGKVMITREIAPSLFVPFIGNAFKHVIVNDPSNPIQIHIVVKRQHSQVFGHE